MPRSKIIVSDVAVLTDLAKGGLVEAALRLPFDFLIPDVLFCKENLDLADHTPQGLQKMGFRLGQLDADETSRACTLFRRHRARLSLNDCFALRLAKVHVGIVMTGEESLREAADTTLDFSIVFCL